MIVINNLDNIKSSYPCAIAIGNFDGMHDGHIKLIKNVVKYAKQNNLLPTILTFDPMPQEFFKINNFFKIISSEEKIEILKKFEIEQVIQLPFNEEFSRVSAKSFIEDILVKKLNCQYIVVGTDFKYGNKRQGDIDLLQKYMDNGHFKLSKIDLLKSSKIKISSSFIRNLLIKGGFEIANSLLHKPFKLSGKVVHGEKLGRSLGYPTANVEICNSYPINGIFLVEVNLGSHKNLYGLASIGNKPTFSGKNDLLEVFILNFNSNLYGQKIEIMFLEKIRNQIKFKNTQMLVEKMNEDTEYAVKLIKEKYEL